ncbi:hypothetical protein RRG08_019362 [Elysia crispata]|uniref:Secreted protein n=1 Tax=Elysia crispata TaxID=231223 RepID=A0AAE1B4V9_9GAST|nr:hypothetical protein RRG08_019362 [Elysia crispata]
MTSTSMPPTTLLVCCRLVLPSLTSPAYLIQSCPDGDDITPGPLSVAVTSMRAGISSAEVSIAVDCAASKYESQSCPDESGTTAVVLNK